MLHVSKSRGPRSGGGRLAKMILASVALATVGVSTADATFVTFTSRAAWEAAALATGAGPVQTEGFESLATGALPVGTSQLGLLTFQLDLVTATTSGASIGGTSPISGTRELTINADEGMRLQTLSVSGAGLRAVGFDYTGAATGGIATLLAGAKSVRFGDITTSGNGFFGIVSTDLFPNAGFGDTSPGALPTEIFDIDNVSFVSIVPEPATAGLLAFAGGTLLLRTRRR